MLYLLKSQVKSQVIRRNLIFNQKSPLNNDCDSLAIRLLESELVSRTLPLFSIGASKSLDSKTLLR